MNGLNNIVRCKLGDKIFGPMKVADLRRIPGFTLSCLVSPVSKENWEPAFRTIDLTAYFERHNPAALGAIDSELLSAVSNLDSDFRPKAVAMTNDPAAASNRPEMAEIGPEIMSQPEIQDEPKHHRKPLFVATLILISGCVYGAIRMATPLIRRSFFAPPVTLQKAPALLIPVAPIPSHHPLSVVAKPVTKMHQAKKPLHLQKHHPVVKTHKRKHK